MPPLCGFPMVVLDLKEYELKVCIFHVIHIFGLLLEKKIKNKNSKGKNEMKKKKSEIKKL